MPYYIQKDSPSCSMGQWATTKEDGEVMGCHDTKQGAIDQALAIARAEDSTFEGERSEKRLDSGPPAIIVDIDGTIFVEGGLNTRLRDYIETFDETEVVVVTGRVESDRSDTVQQLDAADFDFDMLMMKPNESDDTPDFKYRAAEQLLETYNVMIAIDNDADNRAKYRELGITALDVDEIPDVRSVRQVDLEPPAYMRASARRGLQWHREGLSGDGLVDRTVREAVAMAEGNVTADKWTRIRAWIARHLVDLDAPDANPESDNYPSPGVVAMALWGGGGTKRSAERALAYAENIVARLEEENNGRARGQALSKMETRIFEDNIEIRETSDGMHLEGYAAIFNSRSENLGGFTEVIQPGAFRGSLRSRNDIKFLWNHDTGSVLGSTRAGTLTLTEDERGLKVSADLPNTTLGRDIRELVSRGDISGFSFGFSMPSRGGDSWNSDGTERTLKAVRLHEVSLVSFPAYPATNGTATVRGLEKVAQRAHVDADALADALLKMESGADLTSDDRMIVEQVLNELAPISETESEPEVDNTAAEILALKKAKLKLLMQDW